MIGHKLPNKNESATVADPKKIRGLNTPAIQSLVVASITGFTLVGPRRGLRQ